jgi:hypothetical protein
MSMATAVTASAAAVDRSSARVFIKAATLYLEVAAKNQNQSTDSMQSFVAEVKSTCPNVIENSSSFTTANEQQTLDAVMTEASYELAYALEVPLRSQAQLLLARIGTLPWKSKAARRGVSRYVAANTRTLAIRLPNLCDDATAAKSSGYEVIPADTRQFLHDVSTTAPSLGDLASVIAPLAGAAGRRTAARLYNLQAEINYFADSIAPPNRDNLLRALGLVIVAPSD